MGGNVFVIPAQRLSSLQLLSLLREVKGRLASFFEGMEITRFYEEKTSHGDLDVVCGLWMDGEGWKGADQDGSIPVVDAGVGGEVFQMGLGKTEGEEWTRDDVLIFAELLASKLGATKWKKHGWEISFAMPCTILNKDAPSGPENFYQLDLVLVKPTSLRFAVMTQSYGISALLFSAALRRMSSSFTVHTDRFVVRYSPYHGLKAIEVDLTDDPDEFMKWAGLDPVRHARGFKTENDFWRWMACLPDDIESLSLEDQLKTKEEVFRTKRFAQGWKRLARQKAKDDSVKMPKGHSKARVEVMARFRDYIKSTLYADTPVPISSTPKDDDLTSEISKLELGPTVSPVEKEAPTLDPAHPRNMSDRAKDAIDHFGKTDIWKSMLEERRVEAEQLAERQRRRSKPVPPTPSNTILVAASTT